MPHEHYRDRKRLAWVVSLLVPLFVAAGPLLWLWHPHALMLWLPVFFVYGVAPAVDWLMGVDAKKQRNCFVYFHF